MTVQELKDFLDYCDPNALIMIIDYENAKSSVISDTDIDYLISEKLLKFYV